VGFQQQHCKIIVLVLLAESYCWLKKGQSDKGSVLGVKGLSAEQYQIVSGVTIRGFDISGASDVNSTLEDCQQLCTSNAECTAFVFANPNCQLKQALPVSLNRVLGLKVPPAVATGPQGAAAATGARWVMCNGAS
jgi:hypothetical protein